MQMNRKLDFVFVPREPVAFHGDFDFLHMVRIFTDHNVWARIESFDWPALRRHLAPDGRNAKHGSGLGSFALSN